jgi:CDP-diacylglycerol--serine O-phosphatidyltransferase
MIKLLSIADTITIMNAVLGFLAILMAFSNQFQLAASFILLGLLADGFDGIVARRMGNGQMGEYLETIADMISLSVAPLALLYKTYYDTIVVQPSMHLLLGAVIIFSLICSMIRLSSFSLLKKKHVFVGLPTSASAVFLVLVSFLKIEPLYVIPFIVIFALAMISPVRFPKPGLKIDLVAAVFIVAAALLNGRYNNVAPLLLLLALAAYIVVGPIYLRIKNRTHH